MYWISFESSSNQLSGDNEAKAGEGLGESLSVTGLSLRKTRSAKASCVAVNLSKLRPVLGRYSMLSLID